MRAALRLGFLQNIDRPFLPHVLRPSIAVLLLLEPLAVLYRLTIGSDIRALTGSLVFKAKLTFLVSKVCHPVEPPSAMEACEVAPVLQGLLSRRPKL